MINVSGTKLVVKDNPNPARRKIAFVAKDPAIDTSVATGIDPLGAGASLQVYNSNGGTDSACFTLPSGPVFWRARGNPPSLAYTYKDRFFTNGACKVAVAKQGRLKVKCLAKTAAILFSLNEPSQGSIGVRFVSGSTIYCANFGGVQADISGKAFKARNALAPVTCPAPPASCP